MGRIFLVELDGRAYRCRFCDSPLALADDIISRVIAHDKNQIYKEGKFVLERWRIEEDVAEEFNLEAHPGSSDAEIP